MNKGLDIRNRKIAKNLKNMNTVKEGQEDVYRFISISYQIIKKVNGKYKRLGSKKVYGSYRYWIMWIFMHKLI